MKEGAASLTLYLAHRNELVNYAKGITGDHGQAEDVVQEAWVRYNDASGTCFFNEPIGYLYRIVRNLSVDGLRRAILEDRHRGAVLDDVADRVAADSPSPEAVMIARSELEAMRAAIAELPERTRIAMEMHRFGGCKLREIADHLGISVTRVHGLITEGLNHCRNRLDRSA